MNNQYIVEILGKDKTGQAFKQVQGNAERTKQSILNLKNALIGLGVGAVAKSFVDVGKQVENLSIRFRFLFGSAEEGAKAFDNLTKYAAKVPFSLQQISGASGNLAVVANDAEDLNRILEITGNVAAVTGLDFETTASQIQRAFSGGISAADLFRERGVKALLGFGAGAKVTADETIARFEELFSGEGKFAKATEELSKTLEGTLSMIGDKYFKFQKDVAKNFFDELKKEFGDLDKYLADNELQIQAFAQDLGTVVAKSIIAFGDAIVLVKDNSELLFNVLKSIIYLKIALFAINTAKAFALLASGIYASAGASEVFLNTWTFGGKAVIGRVAGVVSSVIGMNDEMAPSFKKTGQQILQLFKDLDGFVEKLDLSSDAFLSAEQSAINFQNSMAKVQKAMNPQQAIKSLDEFLKKNEETYAKIAENTKEFHQTELQKIQEKETEELKVVQDSLNKLKTIKEKVDNDVLKITDESYEKLISNIDTQERLIQGIKAKYGQLAIDEKKRIYEEELKLGKEILEEFKKLEEERIESIRKEGDAISNLQQNWIEYYDTFRAGKEVGDALFNSIQSVSGAIGDAVAQSIVFGKNFKETFGNAARQILARLISSLVDIGVKMILNATIGSAIRATELGQSAATASAISAMYATPAALVSLATMGTNSIPASAGIASTVMLSNAIAMAGGIPRQNGGQVFAGQMYTVGENGREAFIPNQSGTIISNRDLGRATTVNVNVYANDTQGFDDLLVKRRSIIVNVINDALNSRGKEALI